MKRIVQTIFICLMLVLAVTEHAAAQDVQSALQESRSSLDTDSLVSALPREARESLGNITPENSGDLLKGLEQIYERGRGEIAGRFKQAASSGLAVIAAVLFCSLATNLNGFSKIEISEQAICAAGALAVTGLAVGNIHSVLSQCRNAIADIGLFSRALLPVMAGAGALNGAPTSALVRNTITIFFSDLFITTVNTVIMPLLYAYIAILTANAVLANDMLRRIGDFIKWGSSMAAKIFLSVFISYIGVIGANTGTADSVALKSAKLAISGAVPVVGGVISDATEAVLVGAGIIKNAVGVYGLLGVCAICFLPFVTIGLHYICFKAAAALASSACNAKLMNLIDGIGSCFGIALGMLFSCALLLFTSLILAILAAGGA